jgi:hypothetical protein
MKLALALWLNAFARSTHGPAGGDGSGGKAARTTHRPIALSHNGRPQSPGSSDRPPLSTLRRADAHQQQSG